MNHLSYILIRHNHNFVLIWRTVKQNVKTPWPLVKYVGSFDHHDVARI